MYRKSRSCLITPIMPITCRRRMPLSHMMPIRSARMTQIIHAKLQTPRLRLNVYPLPHRRPKRRSARCRRSERLLRATPPRPRLRRRQRRLQRDKSHPKWMHLNSPHPKRLHLVRPRPESPHPNRPHLTIQHMKIPRQNRLHPMPTRRLLKNQTHSARAGASAAVKSGADMGRARQTQPGSPLSCPHSLPKRNLNRATGQHARRADAMTCTHISLNSRQNMTNSH